MRTLPLLILRALLTKRSWLAFQNIVRQDTFAATDFRRMYGHIERLHEVAAGDISPSILGADIEIAYTKGSQLDEMLEILGDVAAAPLLEHELLENRVREFVQKSLLTQAAEYTIGNVQSARFDAEHVADLVSSALETGGRLDAQVADYGDAPLPGAIHDRPARIHLGFGTELDTAIGGGIAAGELVVLLAPPSRGKTSYLLKAVAVAAGEGRRVLHVTLEIANKKSTGFKVTRRLDQALTKLTKDGLETYSSLVEKARSKLAGRIYIKDWSHAQATVGDIKALVRRMRARGQGVDLVVVDYLELLRPSAHNRQDSIRFAYGDLGKEIRAAANELDVPMLTAWQVNRSGADTQILRAGDISECWEIVKHADTIIGLNQTDAELENKRMRINIIKQREGTTRGTFQLYSDLSRMDIREIEKRDLGCND